MDQKDVCMLLFAARSPSFSAYAAAAGSKLSSFRLPMMEFDPKQGQPTVRG